MRTIIATLTLGIALSLTTGLAGCSKDEGGASCEKVTDHFLSVAPDEIKGQLGDKKAMIEKCEKELTEADRKCALAAKDMQGIMKCSAEAKKRKQG